MAPPPPKGVPARLRPGHEQRAELEPKLCYFLLLKKTPNSIARLCSYAKPIFDAIGIHLISAGFSVGRKSRLLHAHVHPGRGSAQ